MRQLSEQEKSINLKQIERIEKEKELQDLTLEILENEVLMLPKKTKLALLSKEHEVRTVKSNVEFHNNKIKVLKDQIVNGVQEKEEVKE